MAGLKVRFLLPLLVDAFIVRTDADNLVAFSQQLASGKAGKDGNAGLLNFFSQPLYKAVDRDYIVAVVLQWRRRKRQAVLAFFREEVNVFMRHLSTQRRFITPARDQFIH